MTSGGRSLQGVTVPMSAAAERLGRAALATVFRGVRAIGPPRRFARAMIDVDTVVKEGDPEGVRVERSVVEEEPRDPVAVPGGNSVPPLEGVHTTMSLLDVTNPDYSFRNGYLVDPELRLIAEKKVVSTFPLLRVAMVPLEQPVRLHGSVALISTARNYSHWLLLALPLVELYRAALGGDPDYFYVGSGPSRLQIESLELLGVPRERVLGHAVTADRLLAVVPDRTEGYDADFLLFASRHLETDGTRSPGPRRVLVSRAGAAHRRLLNEEACAAALRAAFGVELVATDSLSLREEIELFRSAELVVGAHGAGLANFAFAPEGAVAVELVSSTYWDSIFAQLAAVKRLRYALIRGDSQRPRRGVPPVRHDFVVDVAETVATVERALEASGT